MKPQRTLSVRKCATAILVCAFFIWVKLLSRNFPLLSQSLTKGEESHVDLTRDYSKFWRSLHEDLAICDPGVSTIPHVEDAHLDLTYSLSDDRPRPNYLQLSLSQQASLADSHTCFVSRIRANVYQLPYINDTSGVVTTASRSYLPVTVVSIRMLRKTGCILPIEVFITSQDDADPFICSTVLPELGAQCVVFQELIGHELGVDHQHGAWSHKYQYKIMSILLSSFEKVLFLDSDCFPIQNPEVLFVSEPFLSTGLILWPDFWYPSESPEFFEITGISQPSLNASASTEAGEILYSKREHAHDLLLAAYYNYYGPKYYYSLQSQGAPGEGDKETFLWAAVALNTSFHRVRTPVHKLGYHALDGTWRGSAMAQFDPRVSASSDVQDRTADSSRARPFFMHVNFPKLDPGQIFEDTSFGVTGPTRDSNGVMRRIWHAKVSEAIEFFGFDLEKMVWSVVREVACEFEHVFSSWAGRSMICEKAEDYWKAVLETDA